LRLCAAPPDKKRPAHRLSHDHDRIDSEIEIEASQARMRQALRPAVEFRFEVIEGVTRVHISESGFRSRPLEGVRGAETAALRGSVA
jgi:hypothetical protein